MQTLRWSHWRFAVVVALLGIGFCYWASFDLPALLGSHRWQSAGDVWVTVNSAQWASTGAIGTIYQANPWLLALPGFEALLAPVVWLGIHWNLVPAYPSFVDYPSMWRLIGPFMFATGATCTLGVDYLANSLGIALGRRRLIAVGVTLLVVAPTCGIIAGHPEDLVALALCCLNLAFLIRGRPGLAAASLSGAILMQTWAGLLLPILFVATPAGRRLATIFTASALPLLVGVLLLALDYSHASLAFFAQPQTGLGQHLPWWNLTNHVRIFDGATYVEALQGSTTRTAAVAVAVIAAFLLRRDPSPKAIITASAVVLFARGIFEAEFYPYYLAPAAVMLVLLAAGPDRTAKRWATAAVAAALIYASAPMSYVDVSYSAIVAMAVLLVSAGISLAASSDRPAPGRVSPEIIDRVGIPARVALRLPLRFPLTRSPRTPAAEPV